MEDTLREALLLNSEITKMRLNPCFNGRYSQRYIFVAVMLLVVVLILVLMEDTLRVHKVMQIANNFSLNPCFNGRYSQRTKRQGKYVSLLS